MSEVNKRKEMLGIHPATASSILLRDILFDYVQKSGVKCYRCEGNLERSNFSIEHKDPWMKADNPREAFFDLDNISYSHQKCNYKAAKRKILKPCGTVASYKRGCRCDECREAQNSYRMSFYTPEKRRKQYLKTGS